MKSPELPTLTPAERAEPLIRALLDCYRRSARGRTGQGTRDFSIPYEKLVHEVAKATVAEQRRGQAVLGRLRAAGLVRWTNKAIDRDQIRSIFVMAAHEAQFFRVLGETAPGSERQAVVDELARHLELFDDTAFASEWRAFLQEAMDDAATGRGIAGLPHDPALHCEVILAAAAVVKNKAPILIRRLSAEKLDDSKLLALRRPSVERLMSEFLPAEVASFEAWQLIDVPPVVRLFGPLSVGLPDGRFAGELSAASPYALSEESLANAVQLATSARRCISIENQAIFQEAVACVRQDLLVFTSYPSRSVVRLLQMLPSTVKLLHWGDTDPAGFDILRVLRLRSSRTIEALHMKFRPGPDAALRRREMAMLARLLKDPLLADVRPELLAMQRAESKGRFEQESLPKELVQNLAATTSETKSSPPASNPPAG